MALYRSGPDPGFQVGGGGGGGGGFRFIWTKCQSTTAHLGGPGC